MGQISKRLTEYCESDFYAFHMPGHKRNDGPECVSYRTDITEIDGFDNLHNPQDLLQTLPKRIQQIYHCNRAWVSLNGSTGGILMSIAAVCTPGDTLLMARNCHQAVYHAAELCRLQTVYLYPQMDVDADANINGAILPEDVARSLEEHANVRAVVITSPTYEGICSDICEIAKIVHAHNAILIVDAAHGAHLGLASELPDNPIRQGADIVVMSLHKTLSAMTQTAIVCANCDEQFGNQLQRYYDIFMSSSPSYPMMCSVEHCLDELESPQLQEKFAQYWERIRTFREACKSLHKLQVLSPERYRSTNAYDDGKLVILTSESKYSGPELMGLLRERFHLEMEMASAQYVLAMTSIYDTQEGFDRLWKALKQLDAEDAKTRLEAKAEETEQESEGTSRERNTDRTEYEQHIQQTCSLSSVNKLRLHCAMNLGDAMDADAEWIALSEATERIAAGYVVAYPPDIPIIAPGECISKEVLDAVERMLLQNVNIVGVKREGENRLIRCVRK